MHDLLVQKGFAQHLAGMLHEDFQYPEFGAGQIGPAAVAANIHGLLIKLQLRIAAHFYLGLVLVGHAPQNGIDAYIHLLHAEWLGQVIVCALAETGYPVLLGTQRRHQDDRDTLALAHLGEHLQATAAG